MKSIRHLFSILMLSSMLFISCDKDEDNGGCTDPLSYNYDSGADTDNGTCEYYYGGRDMGQIDVGAITDMNNEFDIYFDGDFIGHLSHYFPNGLDCGNPDAIGRIIESGTHVVRAVGNGGTVIREGYVDLSPQDCLVVLLENLPLVDGGGNGTGDAIFWINDDFGCGPITVNVSGAGSSTIVGYFNAAPDCSNTGSGGDFNNLAPGSYSYTASCSGISWSGSLTITEDNCSRIELLGSGGGGDTGDAIFWINSDLGCGPITVNVSGAGSSTITGFFNSTPDCSNTNSGGNFNNLSPGSYSYTASCSNSNWSGTFVINENNCSRVELVGSGGGGDNGDVIFWINSDFGCGPITVNLSGVGTRTINGFWNAAPDCTDLGAGGNFNDVPPGNYSFSASCSSLSWNGTVTISDNTCTRFQLYN